MTLERSDLLRQEETMHILNNYQTFSAEGTGDAKRLTHQEGAERRSALGALLDHFVKNGNDSDCIYIFENLPQDLQKELDDMAGKISKQNQILIVEKDKMIEENNKTLKQLDVMIEATTQFNKQITNDIHIQECQIEAIRELNRQLGI